MAMTKREFLAKNEIRKILSQEGYPTYSYLIQDFDIHLTKDPKVIGYMEPGRGVICVNEGLDLEQVSVVVRHEILHEYLNHMVRFQKHLGDEAFENRSPTLQQLMNIAGDYEISNRGYTERDKRNIRQIRLNGQTLKGLVTEDDHADWVGLTCEEMYDRLLDEMKKSQQDMKDDLKKKTIVNIKRDSHSDDYIKTYNYILNKYKDKQYSDEDLNKLLGKALQGEEI